MAQNWIFFGKNQNCLKFYSNLWKSFFNNRMVKRFWDLGASGVGSKVWALTIWVLEVNPELGCIRAQRGRALSALFSRV